MASRTEIVGYLQIIQQNVGYLAMIGESIHSQDYQALLIETGMIPGFFMPKAEILQGEGELADPDEDQVLKDMWDRFIKNSSQTELGQYLRL